MTQLTPTLAYVEALSEGMGFDPQERCEIRLALEEMLCNVIKHGYANDPGGAITLTCAPFTTGLRLVIHEKGLPFDPGSIPAFDPKALRLDCDPAGLGTYLAKAAVDEIVYRNKGRQGWEIQITKHLDGKHVNRMLGDAAQPFPAHAGGEKDPRHLTVRPFRPEEALEISRAAYHCYGYGYEDYIYYPERIVELNGNGTMVSYVAVSEEGRLAGHMALKREAPGALLAELGVAFVAPDWRRMGVAQRIQSALLAQAPALGITAVFSRAVTGHTAAQELVRGIGMKACGIQVGALPHDVGFKGLTGTIHQKLSAVTLWVAAAAPRRRRIFPPRRHRPWVARLYGQLGLPIDVAGGAPLEKAGAGDRILVKKIDVLGTAELTIMATDEGTGTAVQQALHHLRQEGTEVVYAFLNLEHPGTPVLSEEMTAMGFIFSGILPDGLHGKDALVLQYLNNLVIDYDQIRLADPIACELRDAIREQDTFNSDKAP